MLWFLAFVLWSWQCYTHLHFWQANWWHVEGVHPLMGEPQLFPALAPPLSWTPLKHKHNCLCNVGAAIHIIITAPSSGLCGVEWLCKRRVMVRLTPLWTIWAISFHNHLSEGLYHTVNTTPQHLDGGGCLLQSNLDSSQQAALPIRYTLNTMKEKTLNDSEREWKRKKER